MVTELQNWREIIFGTNVSEWAVWSNGNLGDCYIPVTIIKTMPIEYKILFFCFGVIVGILIGLSIARRINRKKA